MPFDSPQAEPALTRRSSRDRSVAPSAPVDVSGNAVPSDLTAEASLGTVTAAVKIAAAAIIASDAVAPGSRRAARSAVSSASTELVAPAEPLEDSIRVQDETETVTEIVATPEEALPAEELLAADPVSDEEAEPVSVAEDDDEDAFLRASRALHSVTGATEIISAQTVADAAADGEPETPVAHVAPRRGRGQAFRRAAAIGATVGVMGIASLLAVSTTLPAEAVAAAQGNSAQAGFSLVASTNEERTSLVADEEEIQAFVASSDVQNAVLDRAEEDYSTVSLVELAAANGISYSNELYTNDTEAAIQWPFPVGVAMSSGFGSRWGRMHEGIDLVPGEGAPIQAIAAGTVRTATESGGAYGVTVYIDHVIDGQVVTSHYAHMQYGSLQVATGDKVEVGDIIGKVGNTGRSYGAHLHFEIIVNGSKVDPVPWMQKNAGRYEY